MAKGLSSGYAPIGAVMCRPHVVEMFEGDNKLTHLLTYGGHAAACAAALANIDIIENEGLVENSAKMGAHLLDCLNSLGDHPILGDVRGLGLIAGIELVKNQETKEKFSESSNEMMYLNKGLQDRGLLTHVADRPRSIGIAAPVMSLASSPHR